MVYGYAGKIVSYRVEGDVPELSPSLFQKPPFFYIIKHFRTTFPI